MPAPFAYHRLVVGYHGCDRSVAEDVLLRGRALKPSVNPWDWLGKGIYFWEHGPERALEFARWKQSRNEVDEPFVIGAHVHLGRCFDLTDTFATSQLGAFHSALADLLTGEGLPLPENVPGGAGDFDLIRRNLDCAVLNFGLDRYARLDPPVTYDTVRGVFVEGDAAFPGSKIFTKTHVQVAVRNRDCILGFFRPSGYGP